METLQGCVNMVRTGHAISPLFESVSWPVCCFYWNRFHNDCSLFCTKIILTKKPFFYINLRTHSKEDRTTVASVDSVA